MFIVALRLFDLSRSLAYTAKGIFIVGLQNPSTESFLVPDRKILFKFFRRLLQKDYLAYNIIFYSWDLDVQANG